MPKLFEARLDGLEAIRSFPRSIVGFYLRAASDYAKEAITINDPDERLRKVISAITFSAMAIEAFINEVAEDIVPKKERASFDKTRKPYRKPSGQSALSFKYRILVAIIKPGSETPEELFRQLEALASVRNTLVHYKPSDTAGKYILPPRGRESIDGGGIKIAFRLAEKPLLIKPNFLDNISPQVAASSFNSVLRSIRHWHRLNGDGELLTQFAELPSNPPPKGNVHDRPSS